MKMWVIGGAVVATVGVGAFVATTKPEPASSVVVQPEPVVTAAPAAIPALPVPQVLTEVVDVTDIDPLLDPPVIPVAEPSAPAGPMLSAVGFEEPAPVVTRSPATVTPIPPAQDDDTPAVEVAPMPRAMSR